ncbi:hypothetical protein F511_15120 [Dorcoceras hygrometricum]|uniref:Uncharacterized protein n=1 Tax=Dorcoceras hygrometricum TaxID=472368 RepID=A0A2Z7BU93_9LAMI|nr:hypothetical protein F511_15120 [Dorcoceras hygrometricum]
MRQVVNSTVHGRGNGRLSYVMHLVFGCSVKESGSLPHFEHTPRPPFFADSMELCLSSLAPSPVVALSVPNTSKDLTRTRAQHPVALPAHDEHNRAARNNPESQICQDISQINSKLSSFSLRPTVERLNPMSTTLHRTNQLQSKLRTRRNHLLEKSKGTEEPLVNNRKDIETLQLLRAPQLADLKSPTGINR